MNFDLDITGSVLACIEVRARSQRLDHFAPKNRISPILADREETLAHSPEELPKHLQ